MILFSGPSNILGTQQFYSWRGLLTMPHSSRDRAQEREGAGEEGAHAAQGDRAALLLGKVISNQIQTRGGPP